MDLSSLIFSIYCHHCRVFICAIEITAVSHTKFSFAAPVLLLERPLIQSLSGCMSIICFSVYHFQFSLMLKKMPTQALGTNLFDSSKLL